MGSSLVNSEQKRSHIGHSHGHHHHNHDNTFLTSKNKADPGVRITRIGLYVNLGMAITKGVGGVVFHSQALIADAVHALTDLVSDVLTLATISWSLRPPTSQFPLGYGKVETFGALAVSGLLLLGGTAIGLQACVALTQQLFPSLSELLSHLAVFGHSHDHGHATETVGPHIHAAWLAGGSILVKETLYRATMKVAKEKRSNVLESNAYHHRVDSLTALVALVTISASQFFTNAQWLDPIGGLLISGMIIQAGWGNTKAAALELADRSIDREMQESVEKAASLAVAAWSGDAEIRGVQGIKSGQNFLIDVEILAPAQWTLLEQSSVKNAVRDKIFEAVRGVYKVTVRFTTKDEHHTDAFMDQFAKSRQEAVAAAAAGADHMHEHDHKHDHSHDHDHDPKHELTISKSDSVIDDLSKKTDSTSR